MSRNPCCSGPTASTFQNDDVREKVSEVAIPVVVDLLLRLRGNELEIDEKGVAIPVVVDLLLRLAASIMWAPAAGCRNPCCSGPTASTHYILNLIY